MLTLTDADLALFERADFAQSFTATAQPLIRVVISASEIGQPNTSSCIALALAP